MATRKPLFLDAEGFPTEMSPGSDSIELEALTINGTAGITLVSGTVAGVPLPVSDTDAASKAYVDSVANGLTPKQAVRLTTSGVDLADHVGGASVAYSAVGGAGGTGQFTDAPTVVDGITLAEGDRILVKDQGGVSAHVENGIYVATATTSTWDRAADFDENGEVLAGTCVYVTEGNLNEDTVWCVISDNPLDLNVHAIEWSKFSGAAGITAGNGLQKVGDTLSVQANLGLVAGAGGLDVDLNTTADNSSAGFLGGSSGLEFHDSGVGGELRVAVSTTGGIIRDSAGVAIKLDETVDTLDVDGSGLKVVGLPALFKINDVAVGANVTSANLDELTGGGVTTLHSHAGADEASRIENAYNNAAGVTIGEPVYFSADDTITLAFGNDSSANRVIGIAKATVGPGLSTEVISDGPAAGVLSGVDGGPAAAGDLVYLAPTGGLTMTRPTGAGNRVTLIGTAINTTDLFVEINFLGRNA